MKIGVFDSGLGGLAILAEFQKHLPAYHYLYLADNKHFPYGNKDPQQITAWLKQIIPFLIKNDCRLIIFACNTATATSLPLIQEIFSPQGIKILGVIRPTTEFLAEKNFSQVAVMGTINTIKTKVFINDWQKIFPHRSINIFPIACPGLAESIETGNQKDIIANLDVCLSSIDQSKIEALILGCTHYGLITDLIKERVNVPLISQGEIVTDKLIAYLKNHPQIENSLSRTGKIDLVFTGSQANYQNQIKIFLKRDVNKIQLVKVDNLKNLDS